MKIKIYLVPFIAVAAAFFLYAFSAIYPGGAPAGYTGSPGDAQDCHDCHGGSATTTSGMISTNIPSNGYMPDSIYQVTVSVTGSGSKGFEVSPQDSSGTQLGTLIAGSNNHLTGGTKYVTQNARINSSPATWIFQWKAPAAGTGNVTFYAAYIISKLVTKLENITVPENTNAPLSVVASASPDQLCLGDSTQLNASASGGSGSYTYSWTSVPPGFTSTQQDPWAVPLVNTAYTVEVSDANTNASSSVTVPVTSPPTAYAGPDSTVCAQLSRISLNGISGNSSSTLWSTSGDGTFANPGNPHTDYTFGGADKATGSVDLTLTANPMSPCSSGAVSHRHLILDPCNGINFLPVQDFSFNLSPNPSKGVLNIALTSKFKQSAVFQLIRADGKLVFEKILEIQPGNNIMDFDLTGNPAGLYLVRIIAGEVNKIKTVILN